MDVDFHNFIAEEIKEALAYDDMPSAVSKIKDYFEQQDRVELNIAVTGESGSGKSTFINVFRGLEDEEEGAAPTDVVEGTKKATPYSHPKHPDVKLWDLPGIGTPNFKADKYLKQVEFSRYDFFIIIAAGRFRECHAKLAAEIVKMEKKFYFVRSKIDSNIYAEKKRKSTIDEQKTLDRIRKDCTEGLEKIGVKSPKVFLISNFDLHLYDFNHLVKTIEADLPQHKRHVFWLALPNLTLEINEKKKELQDNIWKSSLLSAAAAAGAVATLPISFVSEYLFKKAEEILVTELKRYYSALGLDPDSLQKLSDRSGKTVDELKAVMKSPLHAGINKDLIKKLMKDIYSDLGIFPKKYKYLIIVLVSLVAGFVVFVKMFCTLKHHINKLHEDAQNLLTFVTQVPVSK